MHASQPPVLCFRRSTFGEATNQPPVVKRTIQFKLQTSPVVGMHDFRGVVFILPRSTEVTLSMLPGHCLSIGNGCTRHEKVQQPTLMLQVRRLGLCDTMDIDVLKQQSYYQTPRVHSKGGRHVKQ
jgi:hypothetical protein